LEKIVEKFIKAQQGLTGRVSTPTGRKISTLATLICTCSLAALTAGNASAETISQVYTFGDSTSDVGSTGLVYTSQGKLWIEYVGTALGYPSTYARSYSVDENNVITVTKRNGSNNNYAVGGAPIVPTAESYGSLDEQISSFVADHKQFKKNDLVFIWGGGNDLGLAPRGAAGPFDYVPNNLTAFVSGYKAQIDKLQALGARNIVAFGLPIGLQPDQALEDIFQGLAETDPDAAAIYTPQSASKYKADFAAQIVASEKLTWKMLKSEGVYVLDFNKLAEDVRTNLPKYGFKYGNDNYQGRGDPTASDHPETFPNDGNIFSSNPPHYTDAMHRVIADFTLAQLRARDQHAGVLLQSDTLMRLGAERADDAIRQGLAAAPASDGAGRWRVYGGAMGGGDLRRSSGGTDKALTTDALGAELGADGLLSPDWLVGVKGSVTKLGGEFAQGTGGYDANTFEVSLYNSLRLTPKLRLNGSLHYGRLDYTSLYRDTPLGLKARVRAEGETTGSFVGGKVGLTYAMGGPSWMQEVTTSVSYGKTRLDAYSENKGPIALAYGNDDLESNRVSIGYHIEKIDPASKIRPFFDLTLDQNLAKKTLKVNVGPTPDMLVAYQTEPGTTKGQVGLGVGFSWIVDDQSAVRVLLQQTVQSGKRTESASLLRLNYSRSF
jgi:phospholipase/lecithinase/hemolysin